MNLGAEQKRAMENDLQTGKIPLANQRPVLTAPSVKLAEVCRFYAAICAIQAQRSVRDWKIAQAKIRFSGLAGAPLKNTSQASAYSELEPDE